MIVVLMGVSGVGKTTVGKALSKALRCRFIDADTHHSAASIAKMRSGVALEERDRAPWLARLRQEIEALLATETTAVLACSALRDAHRRALAKRGEPVRFVYLRASFNLVSERLSQRASIGPRHFMHPALLRSQLDTLEAPADALAVDASLPVHRILAAIRSGLKLGA